MSACPFPLPLPSACPSCAESDLPAVEALVLHVDTDELAASLRCDHDGLGHTVRWMQSNRMRSATGNTRVAAVEAAKEEAERILTNLLALSGIWLRGGRP
jgi:hypothetical protein